jgi:RNA polymerase sigma factor (TIGR02999 family)
MSQVTQLLQKIADGEPSAAAQLLPLVYDELRRLAAAKLSHEQPGQTLQGTALVHEAYLRLVGGEEEQSWNGRGHFFAAAAEGMRRILIERARHRTRLRHGGQVQRVPLGDIDPAAPDADEQLLALDEALVELQNQEPEIASVVKLRYFAGLTIEQTAQTLGISVRTANRHWNYAKAWLFQYMQ